MSIPLYQRARELALRPPLKAVLKEIAFVAYDDGRCPPYSVGTIAAWTGLSRRAVGLLLEELRRAGYLKRLTDLIRGRGRPAEYRIVVDRLESAQPVRTNDDESAQEVRTIGGESAQPAQESAHPTAESAQPTAESAHPVRTLDIDKSKRKNKQPAARSLDKFTLPGWIPPKTWDDYEEMRKKIRRPMTDAARQLVVGSLTNLRDAGHSPKAVLEQSISNSWQAVYPPKENGSGRQNRGQQNQDSNLAALKQYKASLVDQ